MMKKSDLKDSMLVQDRVGDVYIVAGEKIVCKNGYVYLESFNEDLKIRTGFNRFDILEVRKNDKLITLDGIEKEFKKCTLIYKRDEIFETELEFDKSLKEGETKSGE